MTSPELKRLFEIGFELAGEWLLVEDDPQIDLVRFEHAANVLYAFTSADELLYIGRSERSLRLRMDGYQLGGPPRSMRSRNRDRIRAMLELDQPVELYAMADPGNLVYGSFRINLAAGLQHSLTEALDPPWNRAGAATAARAPRPTPRRYPDASDDAYTDLTVERPRYRFLVGCVYLDKGFFNVPLRYSKLLGADRERIKILCGAERLAIHGHIDRSSNTNATPRIVGGTPLGLWFEEHAGIDNPVDIDILAPNAVWIRNPGTRFE